MSSLESIAPNAMKTTGTYSTTTHSTTEPLPKRSSILERTRLRRHERDNRRHERHTSSNINRRHSRIPQRRKHPPPIDRHGTSHEVTRPEACKMPGPAGLGERTRRRARGNRRRVTRGEVDGTIAGDEDLLAAGDEYILFASTSSVLSCLDKYGG
jgi:hypothetical protein